MFYQQQRSQDLRELGYSGGSQNKMNSQYNNNLKQGLNNNQNNPYLMMNQQQQQGQYGGYNQGYMQQNNMNRNYQG